jgi:hypothetical protein
MRAPCKKCGTWFKVDLNLETLIYAGIIHHLDIVFCPACTEEVADQARYEEELTKVINEL